MYVHTITFKTIKINNLLFYVLNTKNRIDYTALSMCSILYILNLTENISTKKVIQTQYFYRQIIFLW